MRSFTRSRFLRVAAALAVVAAGAGTVVVAREKTPTAGKGGTAVVHLAGGKRIGAPAGLDVPAARWFDTGLDAGEPTIAHSADGSMFFVGADIDSNLSQGHTPNQVDVARSDDRAESWEVVSPRVGPVNRHPITLDPYIWMDEDTGRLFNIDLTVACSYLSYSDDEGASWITNPLACGRPVNDHQTLFGGPPATSSPVVYENLLYYCWNDVATSSCSKSIDGGVTWHPTGTPAFRGVRQGEEGNELCGGLHGHGVVGRDGSVFLPREYCNEPWVAISRDEGVSWENVQISNIRHEDGSDPSVAVDGKGNVYFAWIGPKRLVYLAVSKDNGATWGKPMVISAPGLKETNIPTIDVGAPGKVAVAYYGSANSPGAPFRYDDPQKQQAHDAKYVKTTWNVYATISDNVLSRRPVFISAPLNHPRDPLIRGRCGPGRCGRVFDFIDVEISPRGEAWVPFVDGCIADDYPGTQGFNCATKPVGEADYGDRGLVGSLVGGPLLR